MMSDYQHSAATRRILESLVPVICPPDALTLGLGADIVDHVALTMSVLPKPFRTGLILGLRTYDLGALAFLPGRGKRAHQLSPELAERYYESWLHGPTPIHKQLAIAVGQLLKLAHYEQPAAQEQLGYRPAQWIEQVKKKRLELYAGDIQKHATSLITPDPLPGIAPFRAKKGAA
jgi:hypothetical protein